MKTQRNILIAFILNLSFAVFEYIGGLFTGSVAIISDSVHDLGDALSIGISYAFEKKSKKEPDDVYTYGYVKYSVLGGLITIIILIIGSVLVTYSAVKRIFNPTPINYSGMIIFAVFGLAINLIAALVTKDGDSLNQKAVNLHMLEDVLGWAVVLIGAVIMKFTDISLIDPLMSIGVALIILINSVKELFEIINVFLEKIPDGISVEEVKEHISEINGVLGVHHVHIRSIDGNNNYATLHIVTNGDAETVKKLVKDELKEHGICHSTIEIESENEQCDEYECSPVCKSEHGHHHHHHHH